jgi:hypothetical protein
MDRLNNLKYAPHTAEMVSADDWGRPYSREQAAFPVPGLRESALASVRAWTTFGDRNCLHLPERRGSGGRLSSLVSLTRPVVCPSACLACSAGLRENHPRHHPSVHPSGR